MQLVPTQSETAKHPSILRSGSGCKRVCRRVQPVPIMFRLNRGVSGVRAARASGERAVRFASRSPKLAPPTSMPCGSVFRPQGFTKSVHRDETKNSGPRTCATRPNHLKILTRTAPACVFSPPVEPTSGAAPLDDQSWDRHQPRDRPVLVVSSRQLGSRRYSSWLTWRRRGELRRLHEPSWTSGLRVANSGSCDSADGSDRRDYWKRTCCFSVETCPPQGSPQT